MDDVRFTDSGAGASVYFSKSGRTVRHNAGAQEILRATYNAGQAVRVQNPDALPPTAREIYSRSQQAH